MSNLPGELRVVLRRLARQPGVMGLAALSLGLGIGANGALFNLVNALLLRQLPFPAAQELVEVYTAARNGFPYSTSSFPDYRDLKEQSRSIADLAAYSAFIASYDDGRSVQPVVGEEVTGNYFSLHRLPPRLGRFLALDDDRADAVPTVVLGYLFWQRWFSGDPQVLGRTLRLNGLEFSIVGVAPRDFQGSYPGVTADFWVPIAFHRRLAGALDLENRSARFLFLRGRLAPGVRVLQARAEVATLGNRLSQAFPDSNRDRAMTLVFSEEVALNPGIDRSLFKAAGVMMTVAGMVLLIACMNITLLMLVRTADRRREIAVHLALGCSRQLLIRQLLTETLLLALVAGGCGLLLTAWSTRALFALQPSLPVPVNLDLAIGGRVFAFILAVALLAGIVSGLTPALQASKPDLVAVLKDESAAFGSRLRRLALRNLLVVIQIAMSALLLVGALLLLRSFWQAQAIDPGFSLRRGVVAQLAPNLMPRSTATGRRLLADRILVAAGTLPGVRAAALAEYLPLGLATRRQLIEVEGAALTGADAPEVDTAAVSAGYFETLGVRLLRGRGFEPGDRVDRPRVVVVNETMAQRFWPGQNPIGRRLRQPLNYPWETVVGVARDGKYQRLSEPPRSFVYRCLAQQTPGTFSLLVASELDEASLLDDLRRTLEELERDLPILSIITLREHMALNLFPTRLGALLLLTFGLLGLILAAAGLYGVVAHAVSKRTREIGVRVALGARSVDIVRLVLSQGLALVAAGLGIGFGLAFLATRLLVSLLYGVSSHDLLSYLGVTALFLAVAGLAILLPARRALRVDPVVALRSE